MSTDFSIIRQDSLAKERFSRNEVQKEVHVVAKNLPFVIDVGSSTINLHQAKLAARLHYDSDYDSDFKQVDYVKTEPMTYKVFVDNSGNKATVEIRVMVLTSQHEDSLFRVKVTAVHNNKTLEVMSEPFRVVSKPSQVNKKKRGVAPVSASIPATPAAVTPVTPIVVASSASPVKRDLVMETLARLEQQQREQRSMIEELVKQNGGSKRKAEDDELADSFRKFVSCFKSVKAEDRPNKLRKVIASSSQGDQQAVAEFIDSLQEFLVPQGVDGSTPLALEDNNEAWNLIYNELVSSPESL